MLFASSACWHAWEGWWRPRCHLQSLICHWKSSSLRPSALPSLSSRGLELPSCTYMKKAVFFKKINFSFFVINAASSSCQILLRDLRSCNESATAIVSVMSHAWKEVRAPLGERACAGRPDRSLPRKRWPLPQPPGWTGHPTGRRFPAPERHPLRARTAPEGRPWPE